MNSPFPNYTHLHVHSHFSFMGALASIQNLVEQARHDQLTHLTITDTCALYGSVSFARCCIAHNLQPIIGLTLPVQAPQIKGFEQYHEQQPATLVLLAKNNKGYRSLCKISSLIQSQPDHQAIQAKGLPIETLQQFQGLFCITGGRTGWLERLLRTGDEKSAYRFATRLAIIFGSDQVALALEIHRPEDKLIAQKISDLAKRLAIRSTAVQPVYCLKKEDRSLLKLCGAIQQNRRLDQISPETIPGQDDAGTDVHWLSPQEMATRFSEFQEALRESVNIASECEYPLPAGKHYFPAIDLPDATNADQHLSRVAKAGILEKYGENHSPSIPERLERELKAIAQYGFSPLFLVVADIVRHARETEIPVSSRGSVANSLAAYCAGITNVDPIEHNLLFERFLSPARSDMPDIDLDFCSRRRDEVLDYVRKKYGDDRVALVGTICTMRMRSAVRETAKAYGLDEASIRELVKNLPHHYHPGARRKNNDPVEELLASTKDPHLQNIIQQASRLVGLPHHLGVHAGGVIITPCPLTDLLPLQWSAKGYLTTQIDHNYLEELGLPKLDLLGVSALTVLADTAELVRKHHDPDFRLESIPPDDSQTAALIRSGDTVGVFQCESQGARATLRKLKAGSIRDLAIANAFFKPGPRLGGMADSFIRRYRGEEHVTYIHPGLKSILGITRGVLIFQEQVLRVAREIAGLSWQQAGQLRRGISKMKPENMLEIQEEFIKGCQQPPPVGPGLSKGQSQTLWNQVSAFSGYGFNQGHATAYAAVSYQMAFLKQHYPAAFLAARLSNWGGFHHPAVYMVEALRLGMIIHPPHINHSRHAYELTWLETTPELWMGLGQVRDLRSSTVQNIIEQRRSNPYSSLRDLLMRVPLQRKEIIHLIQCGALDGLGKSRNALLLENEEIHQAGNALQLPLFPQQTSGSLEIQPETINQRYDWEMRLLGYPVSSLKNPLQHIGQQPSHQVTSLADLTEKRNQRVHIAGIRIPGWTGGEGFYLWDGEYWVITKTGKNTSNPKSWQALAGNGCWNIDEWGTGWLQLDEFWVLNP